MEKYKVKSIHDNTPFLITSSYKKLFKILKTLKTRKGKIIHVVGAPGTGKSANIFNALTNSHLNVYDIKFDLKNVDLNPKQVFNLLFEDLIKETGAKSKEDLYKKLSEYDVVLIADNFHDLHKLNEEKVGFSKWTNHNGFKAFKFYILCIIEYLKNRKHFKNINILLQTAWRIYIRGQKYDIFSDFSIFSRIIVIMLKIFFDVVEISYSEKETIEIVKMHVNGADDGIIKKYIHKYGKKPRFICDALEKLN